MNSIEIQYESQYTKHFDINKNNNNNNNNNNDYYNLLSNTLSISPVYKYNKLTHK